MINLTPYRLRGASYTLVAVGIVAVVSGAWIGDRWVIGIGITGILVGIGWYIRLQTSNPSFWVNENPPEPQDPGDPNDDDNPPYYGKTD